MTEPEKIKLELVLSERKLKLNTGYLQDSENDKKPFIEILNEWFSDEKKFIDEVSPLLEKLPAQQLESEINDKLTAKHYVLSYIFDCNATGESLPHGNKKELERIGNQKLGKGKGNTFYKNYNQIINKDLNTENNLIEIAGENWQSILIKLSKNPESLEIYLQNKKM